MNKQKQEKLYMIIDDKDVELDYIPQTFQNNNISFDKEKEIMLKHGFEYKDGVYTAIECK